MYKVKFISVAMMLATSVTTFAGDILTNTNQSVDFLKNPARDAAIGLDGVYSNPAGVAFMPEGLHLAFNWQYAHQTRTINSTNPLFALGKKNDGKTTKEFQGMADAICIPSLQAAYNKGNWSVQFNFSVPGGGGSCEFENGLGSFESAVAGIAYQLKDAGLGVEGYDVDAYLHGRQHYFGLQLGAAYKINEHWSVYGGLRALIGSATYKARLSNIQVKMATPDNEGVYVDFGSFLNTATGNINKQLGQAELAAKMGAMGQQEYEAVKAAAEAGLSRLDVLEKYSQGVNLMSNQSGFGIAPVIGVDFKTGPFNFAAKYEFNTQMKMKNNSTLEKAMEVEAVNKFQDKTEVDEDNPAQLALGAQWSVIPNVRLNLGYHHFFDKNAHWYNHIEKKLDGGTNEYLGGVEWDITEKINASVGGQITRYQLTDDYMNDMSFVVNSYSVGFGLSYKVTKAVKLSAAYFQTNYDDYDRVTTANPATGETIVGDSFTRTSRVLGLGVEVTL